MRNVTWHVACVQIVIFTVTQSLLYFWFCLFMYVSGTRAVTGYFYWKQENKAEAVGRHRIVHLMLFYLNKRSIFSSPKCNLCVCVNIFHNSFFIFHKLDINRVCLSQATSGLFFCNVAFKYWICTDTFSSACIMKMFACHIMSSFYNPRFLHPHPIPVINTNTGDI